MILETDFLELQLDQIGEDDNIITDANGEFSAELSNGTKYLLVEYVGYSTKKIKINDKLNLYVKLDRDVSNKYQEVNLIKDVRPSYSVGGSAIGHNRMMS